MKAKILGFIRTETAQAIGFVLVAVLIFWAVGCESKVKSLRDPERNVTRDQLTAEWTAAAVVYESRFTDLDKKDAFRNAFFNHLAIYAKTGVLNPAGVIAAIFSILGIASAADNVKKRVEIKSLKKKNGGST